MANYLIRDRENIKFDLDGWVVDKAHLEVTGGYSVITDEESLGMKSIGRIYFDGFDNLDYTSGEPVEKAVISGGEVGMLERYLRAGSRVYTERQVKELINARLYEKDSGLKPHLPEDVRMFLKEIAENKGKNKPSRATGFLNKYGKIDYKGEDINV